MVTAVVAVGFPCGVFVRGVLAGRHVLRYETIGQLGPPVPLWLQTTGAHEAHKSLKGVLVAVGNTVKHSIQHVSTSLSHSLATATSDSHGTGVMDKIGTARRRAVQLALQKLGRAEATDDTEYDALFESLCDFRNALSTLVDHLSVFLSAAQGTTWRCIGSVRVGWPWVGRV